MSGAPPPDLRVQPGPHVFVDDLEHLAVDADDHHHLARVLRLRPGDPLTASDGNGAWRTCVFGESLEATGPVHLVTPPARELGLGIALTKGSKPELSVQKATEIGIDRIIVFEATHSVARWDGAKQHKNVERLRRVAREAAMQSRRTHIPSVGYVDDLDELARHHHAVRADFGGIATISDYDVVVVGPEGGWSAAEIAAVPAAVDLGPTVLRAETAAIVASAKLVRSTGRNR